MAKGQEVNGLNQAYCEKCERTFSANNFYTYRDGSKAKLCKGCLTMHINNWEPDTYLWILEDFDVPYVPWEWQSILDKAYQKDPYKITGMSVIGKYFSKMKLKNWMDYRWADSEKLQKEHEEKMKKFGMPEEQKQLRIEEMKKAYENGEINEAQYQTFVGMNKEPAVDNTPRPVEATYQQEIDLSSDLTEEDMKYLNLKWGNLYKPGEWVRLEQLYNDFMNSFDIQGAARIDTLKMICKTSLKMNQAIDCGDIESYQKLSRVYDAMMKSAKFTEAQRKEEKAGEFDSIGQIVFFAEKEGGAIPRHKIDTPLDIVDKAIDDLKTYNKNLIVNDPTLSQMFENFIKRRESAEEMKAEAAYLEKQGLDYAENTVDDYIEFNEMKEEKMKEIKL